MSLRIAVLKSGGFEADAPETTEQAMAWLRERSYITLVLGWSISAKSAAEYIAVFRKRNPKGCVVYVSKTPWERPEAIPADSFVSGTDDPAALIQAVNCGAD